MEEKVQRLPEKLTKAGNTYNLFISGNRAMIYQEVNQDGEPFNSYEVFRIRIRPAGNQFGKYYPATEIFPPSEAFGSWAWWCNSYEKTVDYFGKMEHVEKCGHVAARNGNGGGNLPKVVEILSR